MKQLFIFSLLTLTVFSCQSQVDEACLVSYLNMSSQDKCGFATVPRSQAHPEKGNTQITYLLIKSTSDNPKPDPVVFLQGGPGGGVLELADTYAQLRIDPDRDFVLYDQRGIGFSEALCPELKTTLLEIMSQDLNIDEELEALQTRLKPCLATLKEDSREFSTTTNAQDLEALRIHLGYKQLNLFGGSYGTRLGLKYMEMYPKSVRSAIFSGLFPPETRFYKDLFTNYDRVLDKLFSLCEQTTECQAQFPNLKSDFESAYLALQEKPITVPVAVGEVVINAQDMMLIVHQMLYSQSSIEQVPEFIKALKTDNKEAILPVLSQILPRLNIINIANYYSIMHADEGGFDNEQMLDTDSKNKTYLEHGMSVFSADPIILKNWTSKYPEQNDMKPVNSIIPTLLVSGEFDPVTPPSNGTLTGSRLQNSQHIIYKNDGHVPIDACFFKLGRDFYNNPYTELDACCVNNSKNFEWD